MSPPLIHLGAVTYSHNNTPYAIRAEVSFDFRDGALLTSVRLAPLTQPESPGFVPSAIDLLLHGQWRTALSSLRKRTVVEIQNASVRRSDDADINPVRLELTDAAPANVAVYVLSDDMTPTQSVTSATLNDGLQPCLQSTIDSFRRHTPPWATPAPSRHTRVTIIDTPRKYEYTPIGVLSDPEGPIPYDPSKKYNVFGVVIECRAPSIARSGSLRSEIVIADESSVVGIEPGDPLKSMAVFTFENDPKDAIPFRAVGDVVRVHRIHLKEFNVHGDGERRRSAQAKFYSTMVMWEHDGHDFLPITTREPIRQQSAEHRISAHDRSRVRELRKWGREYVFRYHKIPRSRLYTPSEIIRAPGSTPWLSFPQLDVLCLLEPDTYIDESDGVLTFLAADGFSDTDHTRRIAVQSESMQHCDHQYNNYSFIQFCPSWPLRPTGRRAWAVLRDVSIVKRNGERVIMLQAGPRTSTIIWNSEGSPDYRSVKSRIGEPEIPPQPSSTINAASDIQGYGYGQVETTDAAPAPARSEHKPGPPANSVHPNTAPQSNGDHQMSSHAKQQSPPKRRRPDANANVSSPPSKQRKGDSSPVERRASGSEGIPPAQPFDETTVRSLPLRRELSVITSNENVDKPISSIAGMLKSLRQGNMGAHRLRLTARACSSPKDVRFACKPWCKRCNKYLKMHANHGRLECLTCGDTFSSTQDPKTAWAYAVKLVFEDSAGGRIDGWIEGKEGTNFFSGLAATNLLSNPEARRRVSKSLQAVLASKNRIDCSVKPYEYEDKQELYRVACKIFATRLMPQYIANNNKEN